MKIAFFAPFKPVGHPTPSGDLTIGTELVRFLASRGHSIDFPSRFRTRWIYRQPWRWPRGVAEGIRAAARIRNRRPDLWLTYHTYYKAPDVLGPVCAPPAGIPYVIFQGIYSTRRRKQRRTLPGFLLNRFALLQADMVFSNKHVDLKNLQRLLPPERLTYVRPGIHPENFTRDPGERERLRTRWQAGDVPIVFSAAMFRPGCKTRSLEWVIRTSARLSREGCPLMLVIAGDGEHRARLERLAGEHLPGKVRFLGKIPRNQMAACYSAGDLFFFPGIEESLGMVYLEAQSCGLPAVAFDGWGAPETIRHGRTGFLAPPADGDALAARVRELLVHPRLREEMGTAAARHIRRHHDLDRNYQVVESVLNEVIRRRPGSHTGGR